MPEYDDLPTNEEIVSDVTARFKAEIKAIMARQTTRKTLSEQVFGYTPAAPLEDETYVRVFSAHRLAGGAVCLQIRNGQLWNTIELPVEEVAKLAAVLAQPAAKETP